MAVETHLGEGEGGGGKQQSGDDSAHRAKIWRCLKVAAVRAIRIWACNNDPHDRTEDRLRQKSHKIFQGRKRRRERRRKSKRLRL
jgi:hypothetical protein